MPRPVTATDLELYAINTGALYATHKSLAFAGIGAWRGHVRHVVVPRYCREVERVSVSIATVCTVAASLQEYYVSHAREMEG